MSASGRAIELSGYNLDVETIKEIYRSDFNVKFRVRKDAIKKVADCYNYVRKIVNDGNKVVYGINTGFADLAQKRISGKDLLKLQSNLVKSHYGGLGEYVAPKIALLTLLLQVNSFIKGYSGVSVELVNFMLELLNRKLAPAIPIQGSVGASGDLAPLSASACAMTGDGYFLYNGKETPSKVVLKKEKLKPYVLKPKEGLSLVNGTHFSLALLIDNYIRAVELAKLADLSSAFSMEALRCSFKPFDDDIYSLRPYEGVKIVCGNLKKLLQNSQINESHKHCDKVQDSYSTRCVPQVHGAVRNTLLFTSDVIKAELNSVTDNPLVFYKKDKILMAGNFHAHPLALCSDYLTIAMSTLGTISERRIAAILNPQFSGLPAYLAKNPGVNSGLMIAQIVSASIASENKVYAHPASIDSIPTSNNKEDYVSMAPLAARKTKIVLDNLEKLIAIEMLCASQALEFLLPLKAGKGVDIIYNLIRKSVSPVTTDRMIRGDIEKIIGLIKTGKILAELENNGFVLA